MDLDKAIRTRTSVRKFSSKKPDWRDIIDCIDAARHIPTAGKNYVLKFIIVENQEMIERITEACQQDFIVQAKYVVVVCSNQSRLTNAYGESGLAYTKQEAGAAIQNFLLKAQDIGLATCWIGYFDENLIKNKLKIPKNVSIEAILPIGFDAEKKRTRKEPIDLDSILYFDTYGKTRMGKPSSINA